MLNCVPLHFCMIGQNIAQCAGRVPMAHQRTYQRCCQFGRTLVCALVDQRNTHQRTLPGMCTWHEPNVARGVHFTCARRGSRGMKCAGKCAGPRPVQYQRTGLVLRI